MDVTICVCVCVCVTDGPARGCIAETPAPATTAPATKDPAIFRKSRRDEPVFSSDIFPQLRLQLKILIELIYMLFLQSIYCFSLAYGCLLCGTNGSDSAVFIDATNGTGIRLFTVASEDRVGSIVEKAEAKKDWMFPTWNEVVAYGYDGELRHFISAIQEEKTTGNL
jgi:hypothetical protein